MADLRAVGAKIEALAGECDYWLARVLVLAVAASGTFETGQGATSLWKNRMYGFSLRVSGCTAERRQLT